MVSMTLYSPPTGDYDPPSAASIEEVKIYGISDFGVGLGVSLGYNHERGEGISFEVFPQHFVEDCFEFTFASVLDELVEDNGDTQESVDALVAALEREIASFKERMAVRLGPSPTIEE